MQPLAVFNSLVEAWGARLAVEPEAEALTLLHNDGSEQAVSAAGIDARARAYAASLADKGIRPGDIVILALHHSLEPIAALWGALYLGAVPSVFPYTVPMPSAQKFAERMKSLAEASGAAAVITRPEFAAALTESPSPVSCRVLGPDDVQPSGAGPVPSSPAHGRGEDIAYLQYTSGTTGLSKGVLISHRSVLNCIDSMAEALDMEEADRVVNWLPLYHDYGLFAGLMLPLLKGIPTVLISPFKWVRSPQSLLWAVHRHRGTLSWMPNSAYCHALSNVREADIAGLDLSSLRSLASGAEPVMYQTQQDFLDRFGAYGFKESALITGYGMAENCLAVTASPPRERSRVEWVETAVLQTQDLAREAEPVSPGARPIVSCGFPCPGVELAIVDSRGRPCPERYVGEILVRSGSLFTGYHRRPDLTRKALRQGWYHTGDRGFLAGGELFVCGRQKDMIIQAGNNIYPEDLEAVIGGVPGVSRGHVAAFGVPDKTLGTERIVVVCEVRHALDAPGRIALERAVRTRVFAELGLTLSELLLADRGWIVKTPNGKISRRRCLEKYLAESGRA